MKRREFVGLVAGAAAWPLVARAQQGAGMRRLGVLAGYAANDSLGQSLATILPQSLAALGWIEGQNIQIDWRWASADPRLYQSYAAELVALPPMCWSCKAARQLQHYGARSTRSRPSSS